ALSRSTVRRPCPAGRRGTADPRRLLARRLRGPGLGAQPSSSCLPPGRLLECRVQGSAPQETRMEIAVVTGTSTGIGFATSVHLARHGFRVFAGMRNLAKAEPLRAAASEASLPIEVIPLDVTSPPSATRAIQTVAGP